MSSTASPGPAADPADSGATPAAPVAIVFDDPLDRPSADDTDEGWGERPGGRGGAADLARFLDEKPPHHI